MNQVTEADINRLADRLLRTTPEVGMYRDNEGVEAQHFWQEPPLLSLLRQAAHPDMGNRRGGGGGGKAGGSPAAVSVEAVDLFMEIDKQSAELMWLDREQLRAYPMLSMEARIQVWVEFIRTKAARRPDAKAVLASWVTRIEAFIDPAKVVQLLGQKCPHCLNVWTMVEEFGELYRRPALRVLVGTNQTMGECLACRAEWVAGSIHDLADALRAAEMPPVADDEQMV